MIWLTKVSSSDVDGVAPADSRNTMIRNFYQIEFNFTCELRQNADSKGGEDPLCNQEGVRNCLQGCLLRISAPEKCSFGGVEFLIW